MTSEKPTFGAIVEPQAPKPLQPRLEINSSPPFGDEKHPFPTINSAVSETSTPALTPVASHNDIDVSVKKECKNPFSAFYAHPPSRSSLERSIRNPSHQNLTVSPSDIDLEKGLQVQTSISQSNLNSSARPSQDLIRNRDDSTVWPTKKNLKATARKMKVERRMNKSGRGCCGGCVRLREQWRLRGSMKLWVKILIGLVLVAAAVGIGIGVSKAVGGGVWAKHGSDQIGDGH